MSEFEYAAHTIDATITPLEAFARLRTFTPGRACFILQSHDHDSPEGRYSIVGYRVRKSEMLSPHQAMLPVLHQGAGEEPTPESLALGLARGQFAVVSFASAHHGLGIPPRRDESLSGFILKETVIALFDHREGTVTFAGRTKGKTPQRIQWELDNAPEVTLLGDVDATARPATVTTALPDIKLSARATRLQKQLDDELPAMTLPQQFYTPRLRADGFAIYQAMLKLQPGKHSYYVDVGHSPMQPQFDVMGTTDHILGVTRLGGDGSHLAERVKDVLPHAAVGGPGGVMGLRISRPMEEQSRGFWGGLVGYSCGGGGAAFALADRMIVAHEKSLEVTANNLIDENTDATALPARSLEMVGAQLAAISAAQAVAPPPPEETTDGEEAEAAPDAG